MAQPARQPVVDKHAPIQWSPDSVTVDKILTFCEYEVARLRRKGYKKPKSARYVEAREAILERIYGNLRNVAHRAYPAEIAFQTVACDLTKHCDDSDEGAALKAGYIAALESEWDLLREYFKKNFPRRNPD